MDPPLSESVAALSGFLVGESRAEEALWRVCDLTLRAVPTADMIGITMSQEGVGALPCSRTGKRRASQRENIKVRDIAARIVDDTFRRGDSGA